MSRDKNTGGSAGRVGRSLPITGHPKSDYYSVSTDRSINNPLEKSIYHVATGRASQDELRDVRGYLSNPTTSKRISSAISRAIREGGYVDTGENFIKAMQNRR